MNQQRRPASECSGGENGKNVVEGNGGEERRGCYEYMAIMGKFVTLSHISATHVRAFLVSNNIAAVKWPSPYSFLPLPLSTMGCSEMRLL